MTYRRASFLVDHLESDHSHWQKQTLGVISSELAPSWRPSPFPDYPRPDPPPDNIPTSSLHLKLSIPNIPLPRPPRPTLPPIATPIQSPLKARLYRTPSVGMLPSQSQSQLQSPLKMAFMKRIKQTDSMDTVLSMAQSASDPQNDRIPDLDDLPHLPNDDAWKENWIVWKRPAAEDKDISSSLPYDAHMPVSDDFETPVSILYDVFSRRVDQLRQSGHLNFG
ncbi:hypothetical protein D9758_010141 [Tetrapyrgos nigripes]|uniref:Uncharacterized protein n=1 Tax=Tetrapyrgos nigripes TaxID=182062 RepID=A0A8H5CS04_9AGAR|nr:hypothetical protein D9758_010141 [Tetrapyrgos nigripes]